MSKKSDKEKREQFQQRLNELINSAGSLEKFCELVDVPYYSMNQFLGDKTNAEPNRLLLKQIVDACGVDANWLISGHGGLTGLSNDALHKHIQAVDTFYREYAEETSAELRRSRLCALHNEINVVPVQNAYLYASALAAQGIAHELHVYPYGGAWARTCERSR